MIPMFIVFEGLDGSGTSTQAGLLERALRNAGRQCYLTSEPSTGPVGQMIRQAFKGRLKFHESPREFDQQMAYLFAADRFDHLHNGVDGVLAMMGRGYSVISTRYYFSSFAYHCTSESDWELVQRLNAEFRKPDLLVYLRNSVEESVRRLSERPALDTYERQEKLRSVAANYERVIEAYDGRKLILDASRPLNDIHAEIIGSVGV